MDRNPFLGLGINHYRTPLSAPVEEWRDGGNAGTLGLSNGALDIRKYSVSASTQCMNAMQNPLSRNH
jgi:hypothetical protein